MKKLVAALAFAGLVASVTGQAKPVDPKLEWDIKTIALQQGPELDRLIRQPAQSPFQNLVPSWGGNMRTNAPNARLENAAESPRVEPKKYNDDVSKIINNRVTQANADSSVPVCREHFSFDEPIKLVAFFESPAVKKYQAAVPASGSIFASQLIAGSPTDFALRAKQFDDSATKIVGTTTYILAVSTAPETIMQAVKK